MALLTIISLLAIVSAEPANPLRSDCSLTDDAAAVYVAIAHHEVVQTTIRMTRWYEPVSSVRCLVPSVGCLPPRRGRVIR